MCDHEFDRFYVSIKFFREREAQPHQSRAPLPKRAEEPLNMIGVLLGLSEPMPLCRDDFFVSRPVVGVEGSPLAVALWQSLPQPSGSVLASVANKQGYHLAAVAIQGQPEPFLVGLAANERRHGPLRIARRLRNRSQQVLFQRCRGSSKPNPREFRRTTRPYMRKGGVARFPSPDRWLPARAARPASAQCDVYTRWIVVHGCAFRRTVVHSSCT